MAETLAFFRADDVGEMTEPLKAVLSTLIDAGVPCHYQVVPSYLDPTSAAALQKLQADHRELVFFHLHGLNHFQIIDGERVTSEFGGGRPFEEQLDAIREGRNALVQELGDSFSPDMFTPPCHKYDEQTLRALGDEGFSILSAGIRADLPSRIYYAIGRALGRVSFLGKRVSYNLKRTPDPRLVEISCSIDVHEDCGADGERIDKTADMLWAEFEFFRARLPAVGIMLHHQACETPEKQSALKQFVERLQRDPDVRILNMYETLAARGQA
ncbi:MAG: DUF2334 domain-containing protein [Myxococcota bacterium]